MNKKTWMGLIIIIIIAIAAVVISKKHDPVTGGVTKIGVILPLTGPLAEYGEAFKNGITLAQEKNKRSNIQYIFEDSAYDPQKTVSAFYKLRDSDKINLLINWGDPTSLALAPLMKDETLPFVAATDLSDAVTTSKYSIRTLNKPEIITTTLWNYFRAHNMRKIAVIKVENPYLNAMYEALVSTKHPDETVTLVENYKSFSDLDFRTSILKIKQQGSYDALGVFLASSQVGQFYKQKADLSLALPTFGTDFFESQRDIDAAGSAMDGAVYANMNVSDDFRKAYLERFGNVSQISTAGNAYDTACILYSLDLTSKDSFATSLKALGKYSGVLGSISYNESGPDHYLAFPILMKIIEGGVIKILK